MQLVDYEKYVVDKNFADSSKSGYYVNWVNFFLRLSLFEQLSKYEKMLTII